MAEKKSFALRMNADMMKAVEKWAADEFRSTNGQIEWIVQEALRKSGRLPAPAPTPEEGESPAQPADA
ncbi:Arc family DNA-binding protein [Rufibacter latericius]|uniref:Arc family DNA-binding protein n=1 Tax=Rufibacter latericius TaxID=2487040 RepID=A0A3M9MKI4_9BACT|nr:Arc family DNA-binding protein [Rufibacter latericius]RNI25715.1 Arc family DNA-binding protein [Rufibacter latericius]